jgi:hypothetical protein
LKNEKKGGEEMFDDHDFISFISHKIVPPQMSSSEDYYEKFGSEKIAGNFCF